MRVGIVGGGVIGLCCAVELLRAGHEVTIVAAAETPNTTSDRAGAIWLPLLNVDPSATDIQYEQRVAKWARRSWLRLECLAGGSSGIRYIRNHELFRDIAPPPDYLASLLSDLHATEDARLPADFVYRWTFTTFAIETQRYMPWLAKTVRGLGAKRERRRLESLDDLDTTAHDLVVNCAGLGAGALVGDESVRGVKGQILLHDPLPLDEALGSDAFGTLPRADAFLIGTLFLDEYETADPTPEAAEEIWGEVSGWVRVADDAIGLPQGLMDRSRVRAAMAGIRPFRPGGIRLELEVIGDRPVVHNYGHGGSGFTLSWGCAEEVAGLVGAL